MNAIFTRTAPQLLPSEEDQAPTLPQTVRAAQQGDPWAQRELITSYQRRVAGFIYAIVGRTNMVEDLAQMVFIKVVRALDRLKDPAQFEAWLFRLARNTAIDYLRRQRLRHMFVPFLPEHVEVAESAGAVDVEEIDALRHALAKLRPVDRALLALVEEGRSHVEMAEITGTSTVVVKARIYRARERLRKYYQPS